MNDSKIKVLIIDSGIYGHKVFENDSINVLFDSSNPLIASHDPTYGHGTAVYGIIRKNLDIAQIYSLHLRNVENGLSDNDLINALTYIFEKNICVDIINLSLGVSYCENKKELYDACQRLFDRGTIIVSAFTNDGSISYPAAFNNVVGVTSGELCFSTNEFEYFDDSILNVAAKGGMQRLCWIEPQYIFLGGNSFACAHVTNKIIEFMHRGIKGYHAILNEFKIVSKIKHRSSTNVLTKPSAHSIPFGINKAAIFPFNKEMHSLIRFDRLLDFEVTEIFDTKYSMFIGSTTNHILKINNSVNKRIKNINEIDFDKFDTLILGHVDEIISIIKYDIRQQLIDSALEKHKNIYAFDNITAYVPLLHRDKSFYPYLDETHVPPYRYGMLNRSTIPILAVLGTSSKQGKFTLQLHLRELFINDGYNIGQIGTEPSALLFGMDYCIPMGYNSSSAINGNDLVRYVNYIIADMEQEGKDIIIAGAQANTITYDYGNMCRYNIDLYSYLLGLYPDAVVLCINAYDSKEYIRSTIDFIQSCTRAEVIALVVFPVTVSEGYLSVHGAQRLIGDKEYLDLKNSLFESFNIPIFKLGDVSDMSDLYKVVINYF